MRDKIDLIISELQRCATQNEHDANAGAGFSRPIGCSEARAVAAEQRRMLKILSELRRDSAEQDLLEALKGILGITDRNHVAWAKARAAIAKADGRWNNSYREGYKDRDKMEDRAAWENGWRDEPDAAQRDRAPRERV